MKVISWISQLFSLKHVALAILVLQNTLLVLLMRYSRTVEGDMYTTSTAVALSEALKFIICNFVVFSQNEFNVNKFLVEMRESLSWMELLRTSVPSLIYTIQNNLQYFALSRLNAASFQLCYQAKILTTAVFSVFILNKKLSTLQWGALVVLTAGVGITQLATMSPSEDNESSDQLVGFVAVMFATILSGFAGVYFESILKGSKSTVWVRNIQMGITSIVLSFGGAYYADYEKINAKGFFFGYNSVVCGVIALQAVGGLVVAVVVKYADNILKGFATSFSIILSCLLSVVLFDFEPTTMFVWGAVLVNIASYMYSFQPMVPPKSETMQHTGNTRSAIV